MEFAIERVSFLNGLGMVQGIVERRNTVPILGHVLLEANPNNLQLSATDLEVGLRTDLACEAAGKGSITLSARKLFEVVREAEGDKVTLKSLDNDWIELKCGRARFKMMGLDPRSFPAMPAQNAKADPARKAATKSTLKIPAAVLATLIDRTIFAVSPDEARYNLSGVFLESAEAGMVRMVATDGHRLSLIDREVAGFTMQGGSIIPRKGLTELRKLLDQPSSEAEIELVLDGQLAWLKRGRTEVSMRLVEGEFPDYRGVVPKDSRYQIAVGRDILLSTIKRAAIFSNERYHGVKLAFTAGTLTVSSTSPEMGEASETVDIDYSGDDFSVGFNAAYVQQVLNVITEGEIILGLSDEVSPGVFTTETDSRFKYVVMPMRL
jgi:DNA polymerase-3 subunit beta